MSQSKYYADFGVVFWGYILGQDPYPSWSLTLYYFTANGRKKTSSANSQYIRLFFINLTPVLIHIRHVRYLNKIGNPTLHIYNNLLHANWFSIIINTVVCTCWVKSSKALLKTQVIEIWFACSNTWHAEIILCKCSGCLAKVSSNIF